MRKGIGCPDKNSETKFHKNRVQPIKFNLDEKELACFKSAVELEPLPIKFQTARDVKTLALPKVQVAEPLLVLGSITEPLRQRSRIASFRNNFNERVVIMQYDDIDVYIDKSSKRKTLSNKSRSSSSKKQADENEPQDQFVCSCVRVITQQTDNTSSKGYSSYREHEYRQMTLPRQYIYSPNVIGSNYYYPRNKGLIRNKHSVTMQESRALSINQSNIETDGRTTIMVKNIPNKYTQEMLLEEFSVRCPGNIQKIDFFYLPIDKNNQCNLGYAFINFINVQHITEFFLEFHQRKWTKYKSPKTCELSYAVCQGTLELANHFRHTKTLQQKDKRLRPLIGTNLVGRIREIVECQRTNQ